MILKLSLLCIKHKRVIRIQKMDNTKVLSELIEVKKS